ncbi:dual specificity protein phosphatase family protein [Halomicroarcula sp. F13]|uniref:Dual specificity protein phosphatase family protein n=1 Tax=Haloarcula rubra TaxID=2487747 RepID=A0AAW4PQV2_9EURY|nr:dual specificity protein phosphatase family protein [Halomicroarcula rubra]MBX0323621.1 dual specificity protein phosphatase family protein [Halomicroarcula rubra]
MRKLHAHRFAPAAPDEEYVFGACAPGWHTAAGHDAALSDWIQSVRDCQVERVCCLLAGHQLDEPGSNVARYVDEFGESNVLHVPVPDQQLVGTDALHEDVVPFLAASIDAEARTVVHCLAGIGRTGQVLAAWLVYNRDYGPRRAIKTVQQMGRDPMDAVEHGDATEEELLELLGSVARL